MRFLLSLTLVLVLVSFVSSQKTFYCDTSSSSKFTQDSASKPICAVFHGLISDENLFYFSTKVDEYTLVGLDGSNLNNVSSSTNNNPLWEDNALLQIEVGGKQSSNRTIIRDANYAVEQIGIVIIVDEGKIDKIEWDDGCFGSGPSCKKCLDDKTCATQISRNKNTDISIYVSWYGTDKDGNYLLSAGQRLSQFQSDTAEDYVKSVSDETDKIQNNANV